MGNYEFLKVKTDSPICIKCFRLLELYIKNTFSSLRRKTEKNLDKLKVENKVKK